MKVAIAPELDEVSRRLRAVGDQVVTLTRPDHATGADVIVVTGLSVNILGDESRRLRGSIINVDGETTEQIVRRIEALRPQTPMG
jgi:hypothetical protein